MRPATPRLRHAAAASLATLALVSLAACGGDDTAVKATDTSGSSASATPSTAPGVAGSEISAQDMANLVKTALDKATTAHVTLSSSGSAGLSGEGDADFGPPVAMQLTMTVPQAGDAEARLVDKTMYLKLSQLGDKFLKVDLDDPNSPLGSIGDLLDPTKLLSQLTDAISQATYDGRESVGGDQADHYTVTIDSSKILSQLPSSIPGDAASSVPKTATLDLWLGTDGLIRQVKTGASTGDFTMEYTKWGEDVDIAAPPSDQVTEMPGA